MIKWHMHMDISDNADHDGASAAEQRIARWLMRYRHLLLVLLAALCLVLSSGLWRLDFNSELSVLLPENDPLVSERRLLQSLFPEEEQIGFAIAPDNGDVFSTAALEALAELQYRYREIPGARQIDSLLNHESPYGEVSIVPWPWQNLDRFTPPEREVMRRKALDNPLVRERLMDGNSRITFATVTLGRPATAADNSASRNRRLAEATRSLLGELQDNHPSVTIRATGESLFEHDTRQAMISDLTRLLPLTMLACMLFLAWCFRSLQSALVILAVAALSVFITLCVLGLMGRAFNTISIMAPLVVVIIAVADAVHLLSIHRQRLDRLLPLAAMQHSLMFNLRPVSLATLTTATGFASLMLVSAPALSDFGSTVAIGVLSAWLVTFLLLPALVPLLHRSQEDARDTSGPAAWISRPLALSRRFSQRHDRSLFLSVLLLTVLCLGLLPLNRTDFDRMDFVDEESAVHSYYELVGEYIDRGPVLTYGVMAGQNGGITDPALLHELDRLGATLREWPEVSGVASLVELVRAVNAALPETGSARDGQGRIPDSAEAVRQHLADYRVAQNDSYPLSDFVDPEYRVTRLFVSTARLSNEELVELDRRINRAAGELMSGVRLLQGSDTLLFARMDDTVTDELLRGYALSLLIITLTLIAGLRSVRYGLISLLPNVMPAVIVFGLRGLFNAQIDPFILMLFSVSVGLVVDDTVHILSTWLRARRSGVDAEKAMDTAVFRAGPALLITTMVLCLGSLMLLGASTLYFQEAARLLVPIVALALVLDLTFLPAVLRRAEPRARP